MDEMTKAEACKMFGVEVYDTALPQQWFDEMNGIFGPDSDILSHFVWSYDESRIIGAPRPLTEAGCSMLITYNERRGTRYKVAYRVLKAPYQDGVVIEFKAPSYMEAY
jgi:hypothetical protein